MGANSFGNISLNMIKRTNLPHSVKIQFAALSKQYHVILGGGIYNIDLNGKHDRIKTIVYAVFLC